MNDFAIDTAVEAQLKADAEPEGQRHDELALAAFGAFEALSVAERTRAMQNLQFRRNAIEAATLLADPKHPGNEGKKAQALLKADEATRRMDARQGYQRGSDGAST